MNRTRSFHENRAGSFAVEASMVFPLVCMLTFILLFYALFTAQLALVYFGASLVGERTAYNWAHSAAEWRTGAYPAGQHDGLYWRLTEDAVLQALFALGGSPADAEAAIPSGGSGEGAGDGGLASRKLQQAAAKAPPALSGTVAWRNRLLLRQVETDVTSLGAASPLERFLGRAPSMRASVRALVVEPAEFVRSFELARYYTAKWQLRESEAEAYRRRAADVLRDRGAGAAGSSS